MDKKLKAEEDKTFVEDDGVLQPPPDIIAYNELRSCADLYRMSRTNILDIQPEFQREVVWPGPAQTRFVDSLIKQLPIPSMCFSLDYKTQKWQVIDGLQRMSTIIRFLSGEKWRLSQLDDIDPALSGKLASEFLDPNSELHQFYTRVENLSLPITVLRCDYSKRNHIQYLFTIFHRLNTGGMRLNNQEIRNCIFSGPFNNLLNELNRSPEWKKLNRMKSEGGYRFRTQEMILRFFAFHDRFAAYNGRLARFLNDYMDEVKYLDVTRLEEKHQLFKRTIDVVFNQIYEGRVPEKISITVLEAILVGVGLNIDRVERLPQTQIQSLHEKLLAHEELSEARLLEGLAAKNRVLARMEAARIIFAGQ